MASFAFLMHLLRIVFTRYTCQIHVVISVHRFRRKILGIFLPRVGFSEAFEIFKIDYGKNPQISTIQQEFKLYIFTSFLTYASDQYETSADTGCKSSGLYHVTN